MWTRKTESEIHSMRQRQRLSPTIPFLMASFCAFVAFGLSLTSWTDRTGRPHFPHSISSAFATAACYFVLVFVLLYILNFVRAEPLGKPKNPAFICERCRSVQSRSDEASCACGGSLEPLENWKWIQNDGVQTT